MKRHLFTDADREKAREVYAQPQYAAVRSRSARNAILKRWYQPLGTHDERIDTHLMILARYLRRAVEKDDMETILRVQAVMARFEQIRINLDKSGQPAPTMVEMDQVGAESARKYEQGKRRRERTDTVIIDGEPVNDK